VNPIPVGAPELGKHPLVAHMAAISMIVEAVVVFMAL
jgi:hypothetical protein